MGFGNIGGPDPQTP